MFEFLMGLIVGLIAGLIIMSSHKEKSGETKKDPADWWKDGPKNEDI